METVSLSCSLLKVILLYTINLSTLKSSSSSSSSFRREFYAGLNMTRASCPLSLPEEFADISDAPQCFSGQDNDDDNDDNYDDDDDNEDDFTYYIPN